MKPSERIKQLSETTMRCRNCGGQNEHTECSPSKADIIEKYLDEQYEAEETARKELKDKLVDMN